MKHSIETVEIGSDKLLQARDLYDSHQNKLEEYIDHLLEWNEKINLVSRSVSRETIAEHIVHSLLPLPLELLKNYNTWVDSGTGGGLPGIPLAICKPDKQWLLNDNVRKKMKAVDGIIHSLKLQNIDIIARSISLVELQKGTGIVTKHAFKIKDLLRLLGSKPWKTIIMWKGIEDVEEEIRRSGKGLNFTIYPFNFGGDEPFYEGKGIVKIER